MDVPEGMLAERPRNDCGSPARQRRALLQGDGGHGIPFALPASVGRNSCSAPSGATRTPPPGRGILTGPLLSQILTNVCALWRSVF